MAELIDFVVCIDIPLEVALARRILRGIQNAEYSPSETLKLRRIFVSISYSSAKFIPSYKFKCHGRL